MRAEVEHACERRWNMHAGGGRTCMRAEGDNLAIREQHAGGGGTNIGMRAEVEHMHAGGGGTCMRAEVEHACGRRSNVHES